MRSPLTFLPLLLALAAAVQAAPAAIDQLVAAAPEAAPAPPGAPERDGSVKEWTIMVYMNGKNDLRDFALNDLNEMEIAGAPAGVNLVVEAGRPKPVAPQPLPNNPYGIPNFPGFPGMLNRPAGQKAAAWSGIRRYLIKKDSDPAEVTSPVLEEFAGDMGDWRHLADFGLWAKSRFPARRYMLVVWNHGSGWKSAEVFPADKGISYDDETGNHISGVQLGQALARMGGADIYASDACLMQMAEVAYELKDGAKLIIGSEETEPADGWPYHYFLSALPGGAMAPEKIADAAVRGFSRYYKEKGKATTISAVRTGRLAELKRLADAWADAAMASGDRENLRQAYFAALAFADVESRDLAHLLSLAEQRSASPAMKQKSRELAAFVTSQVVLYNSVTGDKYAQARGLGVYLPFSIPDKNYNALAWASGGKWFSLINWLQTGKTSP